MIFIALSYNIGLFNKTKRIIITIEMQVLYIYAVQPWSSMCWTIGSVDFKVWGDFIEASLEIIDFK